MEKFILTSQIITLDDGNYNIIAYPNEAIHHYIHTYKYVENNNLNQTLIDNFIAEETPLLFAKLQEFYPSVSSNYYL